MAVNAAEKYCPICGKAVTDPTYNRFGEFCCSDAHAEEYVKEVRARRVGTAAVQGGPSGATQEREPGWRGLLRRGCC